MLVGAVANFTALVARARQAFAEREELVIICAGRERQFAIEDAYTAGRLVKAVKRGRRGVELNDGATAALAVVRSFDSWSDAFADAAAARQLVDAQLGHDVQFLFARHVFLRLQRNHSNIRR